MPTTARIDTATSPQLSARAMAASTMASRLCVVTRVVTMPPHRQPDDARWAHDAASAHTDGSAA